VAALAHYKLITNALTLARVSATKCEKNKTYLAKGGGIAAIAKCMALKVPSSSPPSSNGMAIALLTLQKEACATLASLCKFDDFRSEMSSAHDNAKDFFNANAHSKIHAILKISMQSIDKNGVKEKVRKE
jgi:hypothetical protein